MSNKFGKQKTIPILALSLIQNAEYSGDMDDYRNKPLPPVWYSDLERFIKKNWLWCVMVLYIAFCVGFAVFYSPPLEEAAYAETSR